MYKVRFNGEFPSNALRKILKQLLMVDQKLLRLLFNNGRNVIYSSILIISETHIKTIINS
jgi:hypothetical protein